MKGTLEKAFGYQGDNLNLPVRDLSAALPFYETVLGFRVVQRLRRDVKAAAPGAEDCISYGLPALRLDGRPLVCYKAAKGHCSFFPMSAAVIRAHAKDLASYSTGPGTVRFAPGEALPAALVRKLVRTRIAGMREH